MWLVLVISKIVVVGGNYFTEEKILTTYKKKKIEGVVKLYKENGFLAVKIKINQDTMWIEEGGQFKLKEVRIKGNKIMKEEEILRNMGIEVGEVFNENKVEKGLYKVLEKYEEKGYPLCEIEVEGIEILRNNEVRLNLSIREGKLVKLEKVWVVGNEVTKDYVILRELRITPGMKYSKQKITQGIKYLKRLEFVEVVDYGLDSERSFFVKVKEKKASYLNGIVGYSKMGIMGGIGVRVKNLLGTGREVSFSWKRRDTSFMWVEVSYKEPWILSGGNLQVKIEREEGISYLKDELEGTIEFGTIFCIELGGKRGYINRVPRYTYGIIGMKFDTYTLPGVCYTVRTEFSSRLECISFSLNHFFYPLFFSLNSKIKLPKVVNFYEKIKIGGPTTIRGYWENEFVGEKVGWGNFEIRKKMKKGWGLIFYDVGYIDSLFVCSYGVGVEVESWGGKLILTYGIPFKENLLNGKIHLLIGTIF